MKAKIGRTELTVPHERGNLIVAHSQYKGTRAQVETQMNQAGLRMPTSAETASLVYDAFLDKDNKYSQEIRQTLKDAWLWEREGNLYLAKNPGAEVHDGVIIANPELVDGQMVMDRSSLVQRLQDGDKDVRFVPNGAGFEQKYLTARYGEEGADKIDEVAKNYKKGLQIWTLDSVGKDVQKMSALSAWYFGGRLYVDGGWDGSNSGRAFGVIALETSE